MIMLKNKFKNKLFIIFTICSFICILCPFFSIMKDGSSTLNYIYNDGHAADGIILIPLVVLTYILSLFNYRKSSLIPMIMALLLLALLFIHLLTDNYLIYATFMFYLMYLSLIGITITNILMIIKKDN